MDIANIWAVRTYGSKRSIGIYSNRSVQNRNMEFTKNIENTLLTFGNVKRMYAYKSMLPVNVLKDDSIQKTWHIFRSNTFLRCKSPCNDEHHNILTNLNSSWPEDQSRLLELLNWKTYGLSVEFVLSGLSSRAPCLAVQAGHHVVI